MPRYDLITFDCYGTLIDWEAGIWAAFQAAAHEAGAVVEREAMLQAYADLEPVVEAEEFRSYQDVLRLTAERAATRLGRRIPETQRDFLPRSLPEWPPFADTNSALQRLADAGIALAILSNVDDDLLAQTRRHFPVEFEFCITAEQVHSYKPAPAHFEAARKRAQGRRWLHVAGSRFHDVEPARALGIEAVWINRHREPDPGGVVGLKDIAALASWLDV